MTEEKKMSTYEVFLVDESTVIVTADTVKKVSDTPFNIQVTDLVFYIDDREIARFAYGTWMGYLMDC